MARSSRARIGVVSLFRRAGPRGAGDLRSPVVRRRCLHRPPPGPGRQGPMGPRAVQRILVSPQIAQQRSCNTDQPPACINMAPPARTLLTFLPLFKQPLRLNLHPTRNSVRNMSSPAFTPIKVGDMELPHRVAMAPLTRFRAHEDHTPSGKSRSNADWASRRDC